MYETQIERDFFNYVKDNGGVALKVNARWYVNFPDRIVVCPGGRAFFLELKRPGEKPRSGQSKVARYLKRRSIPVHWADSYEKAVALYERYAKVA